MSARVEQAFTTSTCRQCGRRLYLIGARWSDSMRVNKDGGAFTMDMICAGEGEFGHVAGS